MVLRLLPLTQESFAPFGQILMPEAAAPARKEWAALVDNQRPEAMANITFMSLKANRFPLQVTELERHRFSHQMFVPLNGTNHLVLVCPSLVNGNPDIDQAIAFQATGEQSVNYNANIWHAPRTVINGDGAFIMLRWDSKSSDDTEFFTLSTPLVVDTD